MKKDEAIFNTTIATQSVYWKIDNKIVKEMTMTQL